MNVEGLAELAAEWRSEADVLRRRGAEIPGRVLDGVADELDARLREWITEQLTVAQAAEESGYSEDHLRAMVRDGKLPDGRPEGSEGRISIRRCDLPRRPPGPEATGPVQELGETIRRSRKR